MTRDKAIQAHAVRAAAHLMNEAQPAIRQAMRELRGIPHPDAELWLLDLQRMLAQLDVAVNAFVGPAEGRMEILRQTAGRIVKADERKARKRKAGVAS